MLLFKKFMLITFFIVSCLCVLYYTVLDCNNYLQKYSTLGDRKDITFYIDSEFTSSEIGAIKRAANEWMNKIDTLDIKFKIRKIGMFEMFNYGSDGMPTIYKATGFGLKHDVGRLAANTLGTIGLTIINSGDIFIFIDNEYFEQVIKHEIGHVLIGKQWHSSNPYSVMYPISTGKNINILEEEVNLIKGEN